jgi:hypothetical protein
MIPPESKQRTRENRPDLARVMTNTSLHGMEVFVIERARRGANLFSRPGVKADIQFSYI